MGGSKDTVVACNLEVGPHQSPTMQHSNSDFQLTELWENKCLLSKPHGLPSFVIAAQTNHDSSVREQELGGREFGDWEWGELPGRIRTEGTMEVGVEA